MFEPVGSSQLDAFYGVDDAGVVAAIGVAAVEENAGCARRMQAMGELYVRRAPEDDDERTSWLVDGYESLAAEVAAELGITRGRARGQLRYAIELREKLPQLMAVFLTGAIDLRMVIAIVNRVDLITDPGLTGKLDAALATWAPKWMRLSGPKLEQRIDWWVERVDPEGRRLPERRAPNRYVEIWPSDSAVSGIEAQLRATDGVALDKRLDALADTVCGDDPRTREERRADALGALAAGLSELRCECASPDCAGAQRPTGTDVVIHVLAEQSTVEGTASTPGYLPGYGPLPASAVQELTGTATLKPLVIPDPTAPPESGYRPSAKLAEFVRARDLTCRFPGCDRPAECCDVDHTIPYPVGPTHPSNLKCLCGLHHLLKAFWTGIGGWSDTQFADGAVQWTSPSGRTYTTQSGGSQFFPQLGTPTGELAIAKSIGEPAQGRGMMMPRRKRTRKHERERRIAAERRINEQRLKSQRSILDELRKHRESRDDEPPPF